MGTEQAHNNNQIQVLSKTGKVVPFNAMKIERAAWAALLSTGYDREKADELATTVTGIVSDKIKKFSEKNTMVTYEQIHHYVEDALMDVDKNAARSYIEYRNERKAGKETMNSLLEQVEAITKETDKSNANTLLSPASKMAQIAESVNKMYALERLIPPDIAQAHKDGKIYIHDLGFYGITYNCLNFEIHKVLNNMKMPHGYLRRPKHIGTAFALAAIALQSAANSQFGGIGSSDFDMDMAEFISEDTPYEEVFQACEGFIGNLNTLHARAGNQVP